MTILSSFPVVFNPQKIKVVKKTKIINQMCQTEKSKIFYKFTIFGTD